MDNINRASIKQCRWQDVRSAVARVNPGLAQAIDGLSPGQQYTLYKAQYPFGYTIIKDGVLQVPNAHGVLKSVCQSDLLYTPNMPIGVVLDKTIELHMLMGMQEVFFSVMCPGKILSLWAMLQPPGTASTVGRIWQVTSGARSLMVLPKISQDGRYRKLRKTFGLKAPMPRTVLDQWPLISQLTQAKGFGEAWHTELLFFTEPWFRKLHSNDPAWKDIQLYLLKSAWNSTAFLRNQYIFDYVVSRALMERQLKTDPYLIDVLKRLYSIGMGNVPGFRFAQDDISAPCRRIQEILHDVYGLKFAPSLMHMWYLDHVDPLSPIYHMLEFPSLMSFAPKLRKLSSKLDKLREIKRVQEKISEYIIADSLGMEETPIYRMAQHTDYRYYHSDEDAFGEIQHTEQLPILDHALLQEAQRYPDNPFCYTSPFLRGCVRIARRGEIDENM